jgi:uncharacterized protein Yka (UPF0111/DUF47 family)
LEVIGRASTGCDKAVTVLLIGRWQIKQIEQECDSLTHQIIQRLNRTFVTPIDREDIHELATSLDDVMDAIPSEISRSLRVFSYVADD